MQNNIFIGSMRLLQRLLLCTTLLTAIIISGCASPEERIAKGSEQDVYERAQRYLRVSSWDLAIQTLQVLEENYPFGSYGDHAQLELIYAYFRAGEFEAAIASADRFVRLHPQNRNVDYAFYMRGIASFYNDSSFSSIFPTDLTTRDPGTAKDAFNHFSQLLAQYPDSAYALDAKKRMIFLRNTLARGEINVANYYFKRGAYLAAANRGRWVVENMQETPAVPDALAVMAQAYHLVDMQELSDNAVKVLVKNFPKHPALKKGTFDYQYGRAKKRSIVSILTLGLFDKRPTIKFDTRKQYNPFYTTGNIAPPPTA